MLHIVQKINAKIMSNQQQMDDFYSIYVIIALCVFLLWFFCRGTQATQPNTHSNASNKAYRKAYSNPHRPDVYKESREERIHRRLKTRF